MNVVHILAGGAGPRGGGRLAQHVLPGRHAAAEPVCPPAGRLHDHPGLLQHHRPERCCAEERRVAALPRGDHPAFR